jgi:hypothetical protein
MVSDAQQKKADNTKKQNAEAKAKSDAAQAGAKSNRDANRGFNSSQTGVQGRNAPTNSKLGNTNLTDSKGREYNAQVSQGLRTGILTVAEADGIMRANRGEGFRSNSSGGSYGNPNADYGIKNQSNESNNQYIPISNPVPSFKGRTDSDVRFEAGSYVVQNKPTDKSTMGNVPKGSDRLDAGSTTIYTPVMYVPKSELKSTVTTTYADGTTKDRTFGYYNAEKFIARQGGITPIEGSKQVQGPVKPTIVIPTMGGQNQIVETTGENYTVGDRVFPTKQEAQNYIETRKPTLSKTGEAQYNLSQYLDKASQFKTGNVLVDAAYGEIIGRPLGVARSVVEGVNTLDNLGKHVLPEYTGVQGGASQKLDPIPIQRTGDEVLLPIAIESTGVRAKSLGEIKSDAIEYSKKYSVGDLMGGALSTYVPIGMGVKTGLQVVGKFVIKKATPKLVTVATRGSTPVIKKSPVIINNRKPIISKESLYQNIQNKQTAISGTPKLLPPYTPSKNPKLGTGVIPKESIKGSIKTSPDFIPNKPTKIYTPLDTKKPVSLDPNYSPARRANEIDYSDSVAFGFKKTKIPLGVGVTKPKPNIFKPKLVKEDPSYSPGIMSGFKESKVRLGVGQSKAPKPKIQTSYADKQFRGFQKSATVIGKIKLSKDFLPSKITPPKPFKFTGGVGRGKPRKFDEPKPKKGESLTGKDGSIQIVKSKSDVIKLKKPKPSPLDIISKPESTAQTPNVASTRPVIALYKPVGRLPVKKRKPVPARVVVIPDSYTTTETAQRITIPNKPQNITGKKLSTSITPRQAVKITPSLAVKPAIKLAIRSVPVLSTIQPQKIRQTQPQKLKTSQPAKPKQPKKLKESFKPKLVERLKVIEKIPLPPRTRLIPLALPPPIKKGRTPKKKKSKQNDFLGNTKLDSIEGLFRRSTIIHGDKRISKQIRKDKRAKFKERGVSFFSKR